MKFSIMSFFRAKKNAVMKNLYEMQSAAERIDIVLNEMDEKYRKLKDAYREVCMSIEKINRMSTLDGIDTSQMVAKLTERKEQLKNQIDGFKDAARKIVAKREYAIAQINILETLAAIQKESSESLFDSNTVDAKTFIDEIDELVKNAEISFKVESEISSI